VILAAVVIGRWAGPEDLSLSGRQTIERTQCRPVRRVAILATSSP